MRTARLTAAACVAFGVLWFAPKPTGQPRSNVQALKTPDGMPDFRGIWQAMNSAAWNVEDHAASLGVPAGHGIVEGGEVPYLPAALAKRNENFKNRVTTDPETRCILPGVPRITYMPFPFEIFQTPKYVTIVYEYVHAVRTIYTNGTKHPEGIDFWMGDSRGHYEGDTLVADVTDLGDETWFDRAGNFHSDALHLIERYTLIDLNTINYEVTVEDPNVFSRPWKMSMPLYRHRETNFQLLEYECYGYAYEEAAKKNR